MINMESRPFQHTLFSLLNKKTIEIRLNTFKIFENDIFEISYTYIHSKNLIISQILFDSLSKIDFIIFFDMGLNFDFFEFFDSFKISATEKTKILVYKIFSFPEFFMYLTSIDSFLRDCKRKVLLLIDSFNTYLWNEKPREKMFEFVLEKKIWESLEILKNKHGIITVVCKKSGISQVLTVHTSYGVYNLNEFEMSPFANKSIQCLEPINSENSGILHAIYEASLNIISIYRHPFEWVSIETPSR